MVVLLSNSCISSTKMCFCFDFQENKSQYRTLTKTRRYMKDGVVVTSTTQKVVQAGEENRIRVDFYDRLVMSVLSGLFRLGWKTDKSFL